ncbi:flavin reductase family protein [Streptomyces nitrosporeus]|uniref:flavin reductase family protein n=1 Tax=Streptomyces nitrosporeus TaxID=28894 RepID=UPI00167EB3E4|nr:flavin reductase family protein [Streptomyces nitrosporeus]GGZ18680.1 oxidoreductase [Streptomyces nitrosporeus]
MKGKAALEAPVEPDLRSVMRLFPTGVAVLSTGHDDEAVATTINSLTSVTLTPPTVLVSLQANSRAHSIASATGEFCLSFLASGQEDHARMFASRNKPVGRNLDRHFTTTRGGHRVLDGSLAALHCIVTSEYPEGDHSLFLGRVTATYPGETGRGALLFHQGRMGIA